ncbi:hypothetical protein BUALT_Bualt11G0002200 [Buddleja alternifolia]|uniref:Dehydrin n=1 Tax=Buddleja alternifolia TaxID=168488 RepID=A0AAV6WYP5_9LAMI|nr:hypothetical protein BUALT_Bualt11G0002200 [Buddleja alternifolia]
MAQYAETYGRQMTDEYGNPIRQTNAYGNPIHHTGGGGGGGGTMGDYGITGGVAYQNHYSAAGGAYGIVPGIYQLEDYEYGGRRKKGLNEKMKEKLPGGAAAAHRADHSAAYSTAPGSAYGHNYGVEPPRHHKKKGIMDKIKDKLGHRY